MADYEAMVSKKRGAGLGIIVFGIVLGLLAFILDFVNTGTMELGGTPLMLLLGGLLISVLGAGYIGAGTTEAVRLLSKQVKIMKNELNEKDSIIDEQRRKIEGGGDSRLQTLSETVDRLDLMEKQDAAKKEEKSPTPPSPTAWEKKPEEKPPIVKQMKVKALEKPATLPPPPPQSMVVPHQPPKAAALPPPPPKSMQVQQSGSPKPQALPSSTEQTKPITKPAEPTALPKQLEAPKPSVPEAKPEAALTHSPIPMVKPPMPEVKPTEPKKHDMLDELINEEEESDEEEDEEEEEEETKDKLDIPLDAEALLPSTTCPKCKNTFKGDWGTCPFCDFDLSQVKGEPAKPEMKPETKPEEKPKASEGGGLSILSFTPKKSPAEEKPKPTASTPPASELPKIPPAPTVDKPPAPAQPTPPKEEVKPAVPKVPEPPAKSTPSAPASPAPATSASASDASSKDKCSTCGKSVKPHWKNCPYCKSTLK